LQGITNGSQQGRAVEGLAEKAANAVCERPLLIPDHLPAGDKNTGRSGRVFFTIS
jgi:hypothetical protein